MADPVPYDIDADNKFKRAIAKAASYGLDLSFSMGESARIIKKESTKNFILKGSGKYPPLSSAYKRRKDFLAPGTPILTGVNKSGVSGKLKKSIIGNTSDSIVRVGARSLELGTKAKSAKGSLYPKFVQEGTSKMPSRQFLFFSQAMVRQIMNTIGADIANQLPDVL